MAKITRKKSVIARVGSASSTSMSEQIDDLKLKLIFPKLLLSGVKLTTYIYVQMIHTFSDICPLPPVKYVSSSDETRFFKIKCVGPRKKNI
jgi:hypothetical protein